MLFIRFPCLISDSIIIRLNFYLIIYFRYSIVSTCRTPHDHRTWGKVLNLYRRRKRVMLKEVNRLSYLDSPIPEVSAPGTAVFFILTNNPPPPHGRWWTKVRPLLWSSAASTEGNLITLTQFWKCLWKLKLRFYFPYSMYWPIITD